jgi:hypothetical protein
MHARATATSKLSDRKGASLFAPPPRNPLHQLVWVDRPWRLWRVRRWESVCARRVAWELMHGKPCGVIRPSGLYGGEAIQSRSYLTDHFLTAFPING